MSGNLTEAHHDMMDDYLKRLYDDVCAGRVSQASFVGGLAHIMAALDLDNYGEAVSWFKDHLRGADATKKQFTLGGSGLDGNDRI